MIPSVYINLEDDVAKVVARIKREKAHQLVLVCPKRCQLFSDSINLRLLKKQTELLKIEVSILTMDERGQLYAKEAGFNLKFLPKSQRSSAVSDIQLLQKRANQPEANGQGGLMGTVKNVTSLLSGLVVKKKESKPEQITAQTVFEDPAFQNKRRKISENQQSGPVLKPKLKIDEQSFAKEVGEVAVKKGRSKNFFGWLSIFVFVLSLAMILVLAFVILPEGKVLIYLNSEPLTRDFNVSFDTSIKDLDSARLVLPAKKIEEQVELKSKFQSQGKKDVGNKALGEVRFYNFTGLPLNLKAETTTLTAGQKTYVLSTDALQIKPTKYKNAETKEIDENSLSQAYEIIATAGGEDSNLPAGIRLEITNQVFGSRPQVLYAKTETPISGGTSRFLSVVSDNDIAAAQAKLGSQALEGLQKKLSEQGLQFAENSYRMEVLEFITDKQAGTESPSFEASLKAKIVGLAFSGERLKALVTERIEQTLSESRYLKTKSDFNLDYKIRSVDLNIPAAILAVHFEGKAVSKLDLSELPKQLRGKSKQEASEVLQSLAEVARAEITLSPAWQSNFPWLTGKIQIQSVE